MFLFFGGMHPVPGPATFGGFRKVGDVATATFPFLVANHVGTQSVWCMRDWTKMDDRYTRRC